MTYEEFAHLTAGLQAICIAVAVFVGGVWAVYRFYTLGDIAKARAELEKLRMEVSERGILRVELSPSQVGSGVNEELYINIALNLVNVGNCIEVVNWADSKVGVARVVGCGENSSPVLDTPIYAKPLSIFMDMAGSTIDPGSSDKYGFLVPVEEPGVYLVDALIVGSPREMSTAAEAAASAGFGPVLSGTIGWQACTYFNVMRCR